MSGFEYFWKDEWLFVLGVFGYFWLANAAVSQNISLQTAPNVELCQRVLTKNDGRPRPFPTEKNQCTFSNVKEIQVGRCTAMMPIRRLVVRVKLLRSLHRIMKGVERIAMGIE